ncbi:MAG: helix-turn-helix domain-containing protein [Faecalibacterium sp.]
MRTEREKWNEKVQGATLRMTSGKLETEAKEDTCYLILVIGGSCLLGSGPDAAAVNAGSVILLGTNTELVLQQTSRTVPELSGCTFPLSMLHEIRSISPKDYTSMFAEGETTVLHGTAQWTSRLRTILELLRSSTAEPEHPGCLYLALLLHYAQQQYALQSGAGSRPHNETVEQICAYLAANYQKKLSLSEVAAQFYLSPYYLSRLFRRVTGQSIVDYINGCRIEAAQRLLETTDLSISAVAEQTGFSTSAHFRRVFRELMGEGPLQYRKGHKQS